MQPMPYYYTIPTRYIYIYIYDQIRNTTITTITTTKVDISYIMHSVRYSSFPQFVLEIRI